MIKQTEVSRRSVTEANNRPLVIYISESDNHQDMSQSSLARQLIEQCESKGLLVKVFSEFRSQTCKVSAASCSSFDEWKGAIEGSSFVVDVPRQLEKLKNAPSEEVHIATTRFLDSRFIPMDDLADRNFARAQETWSKLPQDVQTGSPKNLLDYFDKLGTVDHPSTLRDMKDDVEKGKIPGEWVNGEGKKPVDDAKAYYDFWANCLNYKSTHEKMAQDVRGNLVEQPSPDVIIMIAGDPHIFGLDQQLPELKDSRRIITGGEKIDRIEGIDRMVFSVDPDTKAAIIPKELAEAIDGISKSRELLTSRSESPRTQDTSDLTSGSEVHKSWVVRQKERESEASKGVGGRE